MSARQRNFHPVRVDTRAISDRIPIVKRRRFLQGIAAIAFISAAASALGAGVAEVCSKLEAGRRRIMLPPIPKWDKATDDFDHADFMRRSVDFERSLLPPKLVFPCE